MSSETKLVTALFSVFLVLWIGIPVGIISVLREHLAAGLIALLLLQYFGTLAVLSRIGYKIVRKWGKYRHNIDLPSTEEIASFFKEVTAP
ncbi:MAG: hypothetical protein JWL80_68 [Parcubacteria group bacterium]|nr:hypothetical protein [Parcubacteria group bacterium]